MTFSYNYGIPDAPNDPADDQPKMKTNFQSIGDLIAVDHISFNDPNGGIHEQVTFENGNVPGLPTTPGILFTQTGAGSKPQLFYYTGAAANSSTQYVASAQGSALLLGGLIIKWGTVVAATNNSFVTYVSPFPNNAFSVQVTSNSNSGAIVVGTNGVTNTTGFLVKIGTGGVVPISYIAIGN